MRAEGDFDLGEFEALRAEIQQRTQLSFSLLALELAALGVGLPAAASNMDLLGGLMWVSTVLWLLWLDHTEQIYKIATYIAVELAPRLDGSVRRTRWESYLRELDAGGTVRPTSHVSHYVTAVFGTAPPIFGGVLLVRALRASPDLTPVMSLRLAEVVGGGALWAYGITQYRAFRASCRHLDSVILDASERQSG